MKEPAFLTFCTPIMEVRRDSGLLPRKLGADDMGPGAPKGISDDLLYTTEDR